MPTFDVSFLNPKLKPSGSKSYNFLVDQLAIKENQLAADGKLSPGDYDILIGLAQNISTNPALTADQRSNVQVKLSEYSQKKTNVSLKDSSDILRLNREVQDDFVTGTMLAASDPAGLLQQRADVLRTKLDKLSFSINNLDTAGDDSSAHLNEYNAALSDYGDVLDALDYVKNYQPGAKPASNFVAYVTTNSRGEINDLSIGRLGSKSGYAETNGLYGGLQIYGKVNRKENGKNIFQIGNNVFSAADYTIPDPQNPGAVKYTPLVSEDQQQSMGKSGGMTYATAGGYKDVEAINLIPQTALRPGSWAQGEKGFLYKRDESGRYVKYVNADKTKLGISDNDIINLPRVMEAGILPMVTETIDGSKSFSPVISPGSVPSSNVGQTSPVSPLSLQEALRGGEETPPPSTSRTKSPTQRSSKSALGVAGEMIGKAKNFLSSLWGAD